MVTRPPACELQEARTGNYILIWSGLIAQLLVRLSSTNLKARCTTMAEALLAVLISLGLTAGIGYKQKGREVWLGFECGPRKYIMYTYDLPTLHCHLGPVAQW